MIINIFFIIVGLFFGSFYNVVIDRLPRGESFLGGRSHCEFCNHTLAWYDLFPVFSFLFLLGKCRYCNKFIGWKYPLIEATTAVGFLGVFYLIGASSLIYLVCMVAIISCLIIIFYTDLFSGIIPDSITAILLFLSIVRVLLVHLPILPFLLTGFIVGICFLALFVATKGRGIGFGDVKYVCAMGVLLGFPVIIPALYIAFLTGAALALILVIVRRKGMKSAIPFGPFLVFGTITNIFWGNELWSMLQKILGIQ